MFSLPIDAQSGRASEVVAQIRIRYTQAKEMINYNNTIPEAKNQLIVNGSFMCPATGHRDEQIQYYFTSNYKEDVDRYVSIPYFIMRSYNVAARSFYEEFLYDEQGTLIFSYCKNDNFEGGIDESRYYWDGDGQLVHTLIQGQPTTDDILPSRLSADLLEAFHRLMDREF